MKSENRYRMISETSSDFAFAYTFGNDGQPKLDWITGAVEDLLGYTVEEYYSLDHTTSDNIPKDEQPKLEKAWRQLMQAACAVEYTHRQHRKDGELVSLHTHMRSEWDPILNRVVRVYGSSQDVTKQHQVEDRLREERNLLRDIMEASPTGISMVDAAGDIIFVNRRAQEIMRVEQSEATDRTYNDSRWHNTDFDGNPWPDEDLPFMRIMKTKKPVWNVRYAIGDQDGNRVYLSINGVPQLNKDGDVKRIVFSIEDVSLQKEGEDNIRSLLDREVELNKMKSQFLSMVSHEVRTPLSVILTSVSILQMYGEEVDEKRRSERLSQIEGQVMRLRRLLDEVSQVNKAQFAGRKLVLAELDVDDYARALASEIHLAYPESPEIHVLADEVCTDHFVTDELLFHQILSNLLSNAAKYTSAGGQIDLLARCVEDAIKITVVDSGIGIPKKDQQKLFKVFSRAGNVGNIPGTGMGLVILKESVNQLGGTISFESEEGEGTTFTVVLPSPPHIESESKLL